METQAALGDYPEAVVFPSESEFLEALRKFYEGDVEERVSLNYLPTRGVEARAAVAPEIERSVCGTGASVNKVNGPHRPRARHPCDNREKYR